MKITFILPSAGVRPIGGFKVVYEYANHLVHRGHEVTVIHPAILYKDTRLRDKPRKMVRFLQRSLDRSYNPRKWFNIDERVKLRWVLSLSEKHIPFADAIIASSWATAEFVASYKEDKGVKFYLIQDYEHFMTSEQVIRLRMVQTYKFGMHNIAISPAVKEMVLSCGAKVDAYIPNGIDFDTFKLKSAFGSAERCAIGFPSRPEQGSSTF